MHNLHNYLKIVTIANCCSVGRNHSLWRWHADYALNESYFTLF